MGNRVDKVIKAPRESVLRVRESGRPCLANRLKKMEWIVGMADEPRPSRVPWGSRRTKVSP